MIYDGIVVKINKSDLYLFILDPNSHELHDGINISQHSCYDMMKNDQIMVVNVILKDGTMELDEIDLDEFIHGDKYGRTDIFLYIQDLLLYDIVKRDNNIKNVNLEDIINRGELNDLALELIDETKEFKKIKEDE